MKQGIYTKENTPKGVYIFTEKGNFIEPKFWGFYETDETPVGAAIIAERTLLVALNGSEDSLELLDWDKDLTGDKLDNMDEALKFSSGGESTSYLAENGSPAALFCTGYSSGQVNDWYLPTLGDIQLMYDHKKELDIALAIAGGNAIETDDWHWTSTRRYDKANWVFHWFNGNRDDNSQYDDRRVRPVSAFLIDLFNS